MKHLFMTQVAEPEIVEARDINHVVYLRTLLVELRRYLIATARR